MSKKSKAAAKQKRLNKKRAIKAANKALYESRRNAGINGKSKRYTKRSKDAFNPNKGKHLTRNCGNPACNKCRQFIIKTVTSKRKLKSLKHEPVL